MEPISLPITYRMPIRYKVGKLLFISFVIWMATRNDGWDTLYFLILSIVALLNIFEWFYAILYIDEKGFSYTTFTNSFEYDWKQLTRIEESIDSRFVKFYAVGEDKARMMRTLLFLMKGDDIRTFYQIIKTKAPQATWGEKFYLPRNVKFNSLGSPGSLITIVSIVIIICIFIIRNYMDQ